MPALFLPVAGDQESDCEEVMYMHCSTLSSLNEQTLKLKIVLHGDKARIIPDS